MKQNEQIQANLKTGEDLPSPGTALVSFLKEIKDTITSKKDLSKDPARLRDLAEEAFWAGAGGSAGLTRTEATLRPLQNWLQRRRGIEARRGIRASNEQGLLSFFLGAQASHLPKRFLDPLTDIKLVSPHVMGRATGRTQALGTTLPTKSTMLVNKQVDGLQELWKTLVHEGVHAAQAFPKSSVEKKILLPVVREAELLRILDRKYLDLDSIAYLTNPLEAQAYRLEDTIKSSNFSSKDFFSSLLEEIDLYEKTIRPRYKKLLDKYQGVFDAVLSR